MSLESTEFLPSAPPLSTSENDKNVSEVSFSPSAPTVERPKFVTPVSQVELTLSAKSLLNLDQLTRSDPMCIVYLQDTTTSREWMEIGRTETVMNDLNPEWKTKFVLDYRFEERQLLTFMVYDKDRRKYSIDTHDYLGKIECSLGKIASAPNSKWTRTMKLPSVHETSERVSTFTVVCEEIGDCKKVLSMDITFTWLKEKSTFPFKTSEQLVITTFKKCQDGTWILLHKTEKICTTGKESNVKFTKVNLRYSSVCYKGSIETVLRFQLHRFSKTSFRGKVTKLIGEAVSTFIELSENCNKTGSIKLALHDIKSYEVGFLEITNFIIEAQKTFLDYLHEGLDLNFGVAIDFTASNGEPTSHLSLHYKHGTRDNPYVMFLKILGEILQDYSTTKQFHAYGFGAKGYPTKNVNHKFPLNFKESNPICNGVDGILTAYHRALNRIKLCGPTCFAPVVREMTQIAKNSLNDSSLEKYFVLLILTDGNVCDPETTTDAFVEASEVPLSIIIIGIGNEDFTTMEKFDSDEKLLRSRSNKPASRDIVQFVDLKKYMNFKSAFPISESSKIALTRSVLAELPQQVVGWMNIKQNIL